MSQEEKPITPITYTPEEHTYYGKLVQKLCGMRDERDRVHPELDGMTYLEYYDNNRRKDLSYIPPKKNKDDIRLSSGVIREKDTSLVSTVLNLELNPDMQAFDKSNHMIEELGQDLADLVKKSRELEDWPLYRGIVYRELFSQGDVFVEEVYSENYTPVTTSKITWNPTQDPISEFKAYEKVKKTEAMCKARMIEGKKVYLGSVRKEYIKQQDCVAVLNVYSRAEAEAMYGTWERFKHVPTTIDTVQNFESDGGTYKSWNLVKLSSTDDVAEIKIFDKKRNRFMILLNGVMMLPINYPLTAIAPTGEIPISQGKCEPISGFAYSKSIPAKTKVDESILDEMKKLMIRKMRQSAEPPKGSRKSKVHSRDIFTPGKITYDIREGDLFDIMQNTGVTTADFSFYQLVQEDINNKSLNDVAAGEGVQGDPTATQVLEEKQQAMIKLGLALDGIINLERQMTWHRVFNILNHWTKPVSETIDEVKGIIKKQYQTVSLNTTVDNGEMGTRVFRFTDEEFPDKRDVLDEEEQLSREKGRPMRIVYLNAPELAQVKLMLYIVINPTPKSNDNLSTMLFIQNITQGANLFGIESFNQDYLKQRYATLIKEDYSKLMVPSGLLETLKAGMEDEAMAQEGGAKPTMKRAMGKEMKPVIR